MLSGAGTESGNSFVFPLTEATPVEGGYLVNGHKIFATNSEIADSVTVILRVVDGDWYRQGTAIVLRGTKGMEVRGNWDALGMRGSGSHDIVFTNCFVPAEMMLLGNPSGTFTPDGWPTVVAVNFALIGAFLGIAEAARDLIVETAKTKRKKPFEVTLAERPATQFQVAEIEIGLAAARATLGRTGQAIDEWLERPDTELTMHDVQLMMQDWQCTKLVVNRAAADVVDRAMALERRARLPVRQPVVAHVPRRACRSVHAAAVAQRGVRVHRASRARPRPRRRAPRGDRSPPRREEPTVELIQRRVSAR